MMFYILALVFVAAQAKLFPVKEKNDICLLLQLEGAVDLTANVNKTQKTVSLNFDNATVIDDSSNCTHINLNLTRSVEVWFQFHEISGEWEVTPGAQFVPHTVFGDEYNYTDPVKYLASPLEDHFQKNESYKCLATDTHIFNPDSKPAFNITVTATTTNLTIQSLNSTGFVTGKDCQKDQPSTPVHTTPIPTTPQPTTPKPTFKQNFSCETENNTHFRVIGSFALEITYITIDGKTVKVHRDVPQVQIDNETDCSSSKFNETLVFKFFGNWSIEYIFKLESPKSYPLGATQKYYVSNITVTYVHDMHLPNSSSSGSVVTAHFSQPNYLEASTDGYYTCKDINLSIDQNVTLITKDFKYKAFNDKGDINFGSGEISECSGDEETSSVVPIAVGAALAGLVVIVLIAYLIGRRRSRKAGYESV